MRLFIFAFVCLSVMGCADQSRQTEDYNIKSSSDLTLSEQNHPHGYRQSNCFVCHNPNNIHNVDRLGDSSFSLAKGLVAAHGITSCSGCHGKNGVSP